MQNLTLPEKISEIIDELRYNGFEAYVVGGCVRDLISGKKPDDYDVTTNALPQEIKDVFSSLKTIDTGIKHGTVTVVKDGFHVEVTTYRVDGEYKDNRRPENVTFSKKLKDDLSRRDFTANAIAYNKYDGIVDCFGGINDIKNKIIRCVGEPEKRFNEDALRILRAVRFSSVLGYCVEDNTAKAVHSYAHLLQNISKERIFAEIKKLICGKNAQNVLVEYRDILEIVFPLIKNVSVNDYILAASMASSANGDAVFKLTALLYFVSPDEAALMFRSLKSDKTSSVRVRSVLSCREAICADCEKKALLCLNLYGEHIFDYLKLKYLYMKGIGDINGAKNISEQFETLEAAIASKKPYKISQLDISGTDLIENDIAYGSDIGKKLEMLLLAVIDGKVRNNKDELLKYLNI